jgi:hypothetical protein
LHVFWIPILPLGLWRRFDRTNHARYAKDLESQR